ncbi:hypothetical protein CEXT_380861 [Caerostris extrusa]|uniref:Uncharacterized protein n=1 Tax=Caerostris extrusa TaxID=172846 RepID=A0AAV4PH33_CAEEX|nr:hypothetical protein CEXT_380861 [Caerostris extrusa]
MDPVPSSIIEVVSVKMGVNPLNFLLVSEITWLQQRGQDSDDGGADGCRRLTSYFIGEPRDASTRRRTSWSDRILLHHAAHQPVRFRQLCVNPSSTP